MAHNKNFLRDAGIGKLAEDKVAQLLIECNLEIKRGIRQIGYDIEIMPTSPLNSSLLIEVKYDIMASRTGNVAIEYYNSRSNKPSGLSATLSHFWFYVFGKLEEIYVVSVDDLKNHFTKPKRFVIGAGDGNADIMLFDKTFFCEHSVRFDELSIDERIGLLCKSK